MLKYLCTMAISKSPQQILNGQGKLVGINAERPAAIAARSSYWDWIGSIPSWKPPALKDTVGLAIITCNRENFLEKVLASNQNTKSTIFALLMMVTAQILKINQITAQEDLYIVKTAFVVIIFILVVIEVLVLLKTGHLHNYLKKDILNN